MPSSTVRSHIPQVQHIALPLPPEVRLDQQRIQWIDLGGGLVLALVLWS